METDFRIVYISDEEKYCILNKKEHAENAGCTKYGKMFCGSPDEYVKYVRDNFNAEGGRRYFQISRSEYDVYSGNYTRCYTTFEFEMLYNKKSDAERALEWMEGILIANKLVGKEE